MSVAVRGVNPSPNPSAERVKAAGRPREFAIDITEDEIRLTGRAMKVAVASARARTA